ncbi:MAG: protein translocase subunit SecD, partial [Thermodesulfobacteriota bacterium]
MKSFAWRAALIGLVIAAAVVLLMPSVDYYRRADTSKGWKEADTIWPHKIINLGLDLQGGMFLVLTVEAEKAVDSAMERQIQDIREDLRGGHIRYKDLDREGDKIRITLLGDKAINDFQKILGEDFDKLTVANRQDEGENQTLVLELPQKEKEGIADDAVDRALEIIRTRVDTLGVSEPEIRKQGTRRILIQLPGIADPERAKKLLGETAQLEFKVVDEANKGADSVNLPPGTELLPFEHRNRETGRVTKSKILVKKKTLMTGDYISEVRVRTDSQYGNPYVGLKFDRRGAILFEHITEDNEGKQLAIVLDGTVKSAPVIREKIAGGEAIIEGDFTLEEARDLAIVLRTSLPAPVTILEERTVGPSLGRDSINSGLFAAAVGGILVILFMVIYYLGAGVAADLALVLNVVLIGAGLALFQATLTLPGI